VVEWKKNMGRSGEKEIVDSLQVFSKIGENIENVVMQYIYIYIFRIGFGDGPN
jgi:hypothetical protein